MRHLIVLFLLLCFSLTSVAQKPMLLGVGGVYGNRKKLIGASATGYFSLKPKLLLGASINYYFPEVDDINGVIVSEGSTGYNINLHYFYRITYGLNIYPIVGANFTRDFLVIDDPASIFLQLKLNTALGANLGLGANFTFKKHLFFAEYKHITGTLFQQVVSGGIKWVIQNKNLETTYTK